MNEKIKSAAIGGVLLGVLSAIPFVNIPNLCCCAWALFGGGLATYLWVKRSPTPVSVGDGAFLGAIAGVIGAAVYMILGVPLGIVMGNTMAALIVNMMQSADPRQAEILRAQMAASQSVGAAILSGILFAFFILVFSTLGGLIAVPIFEKRKGGPGMPPPPPGFGGPQGGYSPTPPPPQNYGQPGGYGSGM
jgi:hypothetical protein